MVGVIVLENRHGPVRRVPKVLRLLVSQVILVVWCRRVRGENLDPALCTVFGFLAVLDADVVVSDPDTLVRVCKSHLEVVLSSWESGVDAVIFWSMDICVFPWGASRQAVVIRSSFVDQELLHTPHKSLPRRSSDTVLLGYELRAIPGRHGELIKLGNDFPERSCPFELVSGVLKVDGRHRKGRVSSCCAVGQRDVQGVHTFCDMEGRIDFVVAHQPLWCRSQKMIDQERNSFGSLGAAVEEWWERASCFDAVF